MARHLRKSERGSRDPNRADLVRDPDVDYKPETLMRNSSALITAVVLAFGLGSAFAGDEAPVAESSDGTASMAPAESSESAATESTDASSMVSTEAPSESTDAPAPDSYSK